VNMKNKEELVARVRAFRDKFKKYLEVCGVFWQARNHFASGATPDEALEEKLREELTEEWGRLESLFAKMGAPRFTIVPSIGYPTYFFDEALSANFDSPHKGEGIVSAISSATKVIGLIEALSEAEYKSLHRKTPTLFISHAFRKENEELVKNIKELLSSFPISIITGAQPGTESISEKVKGLMDDSDFVLALLTKDEEQKDSSWTPSKWVFDEIAYAVGQKKPVIRMLETGASYKGAISGDAEYISFQRDNLTESLIKLVQVLNSLLTKK